MPNIIDLNMHSKVIRRGGVTDSRHPMRSVCNSIGSRGDMFIESFPGKDSFCNPVLFAICTNTFSKCVKICTMACRRVLSSALLLIGARPVVAYGNETYKLNLKDYTTNRAITLRIW
jgi:hypothetical protein